jgi:hypothetical protein
MINDILEAGMIFAALFLVVVGALSVVYLPVVLGVAFVQLLRIAIARQETPQEEPSLLVHYHPRADVCELPEEQRVAVAHSDTPVAGGDVPEVVIGSPVVVVERRRPVEVLGE